MFSETVARRPQAAPDQAQCRAQVRKRRPNASPAERRGERPTRSPPRRAARFPVSARRPRGEAGKPRNSSSMSGFKVAVAGATGNVGREMLSILAERRFPVSEVVALASPASIGREVSFGDKTLKCRALEHYDFSDADVCLMSAGGAVSREHSPKIGAKGCVVIDNSSAWRMDPDVPLIVPEVNAAAAKGFGKKNIIANPNCSTAQLVVALKPLHDRATIRRV